MPSNSRSSDPTRQRSNYQKPYIEGHTPENQVAKIDVPPPAPSPPPPNVFDFLVSEESSPSATDSQRRRRSSSSIRSDPRSTKTQQRPSSNPQDTEAPRKNAVEGAYGYGHEPVRSLGQQHNSDGDFVGEFDSNSADPLGTGYSIPAEQKTPALKSHPDTFSSGNNSEKKRKRTSMDEWDEKRQDHEATATSQSAHSGLTGGVQKMMGRSKAWQVESPSSPKKRSKRVKEPAETCDDRDRDVSLARTSRSKNSADPSEHYYQRRLHHSQHDGQSRYAESSRHLARPELRSNNAGAHDESRSNSGLFLSLIDKGHHSHRGQSIWGTLKTFHESLSSQAPWYNHEDDGLRQGEEKTLMKGLRMKLNRQGEIVLFSRPDRERDRSPGEEESRKKIEGRQLKQIKGPG